MSLAVQLDPEITFPQFGRLLGIDANRVPIQGVVETTFRCNLRCAHCYVNEAVGNAEIRSRELSLDRLKSLIDEIEAAGNLFLVFTGGEVLVRPDFPELYLYAWRKGMLITVFTNATLVTESVADLLAEHRPESIEVSLYGMTRETYERVTQIPGSYARCIEGIERLVERGLPVLLKTMALAWNQHELKAMDAYAKSLGLPFRFDSSLNPRVDCGANRNGELQLSADQAMELDRQFPERMQGLKDFCETFAKPDVERGMDQVYTCGAGQTSFTVDPYGQLQMCQLSRRSGFDVGTRSFAEGWNEHFPKLRARTWQTHSVCRTCSLISLCSSCPGSAEMETGDVEGLVPQFCELAHIRAFEVMDGKSGHRKDATCCLGDGRLANASVDQVSALLGSGGCGSCGSEPASPPLIRLQPRRMASQIESPPL